MDKFGLTEKEFSVLKKLDSPAKIQAFLDTKIKYNSEEKTETYYSPKLVLKHKKAHCLEGALFAAAALRIQGFEPLLVDLRAVRDDDHVLAVFRQGKFWGAIAQSKYSGLKYREPVYSSIKELVMSYFENYFNYSGEKTLREYSEPINLKKFDKKNWMATEKPVEFIADFLDNAKHKKIVLPKKLSRITAYRMKTELIVKQKKSA
ncbi:MAG: transglutaminase domain-containing protein [archaeon]